MLARDIVSKVTALQLPPASYIVFGSGPLAAAGLREANDIDLFVSEDVYAYLENAGWKQVYKGPGDTPITHGDFEAHQHWTFSPYQPTLAHLQASATYIDGVAFASLKEVRKWKMASRRPKDLRDITLIDTYLKSSS
jgi:hypothetical protein